MYVWLILGLLLLLMIYLYVQNNYLSISQYTISLPQIHPALRGKKIVFLSDTHFRDNTSQTFIDRLVIQIEDLQPDIILFGGDIVHVTANEAVIEHVKDFFTQLTKVAPTYVVFGNHDMGSARVQELSSVVKRAGARLLKNEAEWISFKEPGAGFWLLGLFEPENSIATSKEALSLVKLPADSSKEPKVLLTHYPHFFEKYIADKDKRPDLILAGHTHGGQAILPILGGLFAPGQGINPLYDFGLFISEQYPSSRLIISRGVGNSTFPLRMNNRPEIVLITLK